MPNIPTIPGSARIQSPEIGVKRNAGAELGRLGAERGAIKAGASAIQDTAGAIGEYEAKKQRAEEVAAFNQASIVTRKATSAYRDSLRHNPNDQEWVSNWQKTAEATRNAVLADPRFQGASQRKIRNVLDSWQGETTAEFQTAADVAGSNRRKRTGLLAADEALRDGNERAAHAAIDGVVKTGDMYPEEAAKIKQTFTATIQENQIRTGMVGNPKATLADIDAGKFPMVPKGPLTTLRRQTEAELSRQQNQERDQILQRMDSGEVIHETELKTKEERGLLSPAGAKAIRARIAQSDLKEAQDNHSIQMMLAHDHDFTTDKDPDKTSQQMMDRGASLPPKLRASLYEEITNKLNAAKKAGVSAERPVQKEVFDRMKEDRELNGLTIPMEATTKSGKHLFSKDDPDTTEYKHYSGGLKTLRTLSNDQIEAEFGKGMTRQKVLEAEEQHYANQQAKMRDWFKANPDAKDDEAEAYRQKLERPYIMAATSAMIRKNQPIAVETEDDLANLPSGALVIHKGKTGIVP